MEVGCERSWLGVVAGGQVEGGRGHAICCDMALSNGMLLD